jgi:phenylpropionate dioxygenase-like ring-hydroxylating dioxygenase large terminal subunit
MKLLKAFFLLFSFNLAFKNNYYVKKSKYNIKNNLLMNTKESEDNFNLNWYVIGEKKKFKNKKLYKIKIWDNDYLVWKNNDQYYAMDNYCSHRGASLALGKIVDNNIICPYHGYQFNNQGKLCKIPGLNFVNTNVHNQNSYEVVEKNGWIYLNTINKLFYNTSKINIYEEPESLSKKFRSIFINTNFNTYGRLVSENSLDVMHIGFVHTFGNAEHPAPIIEKPPYLVGDYPNHYKSIYYYESGKDSIAKKLFGIKHLIIENEFILPHTTIARVIFGNLTSTVITSTLPLNNTSSNLFVKTYRNFWTTNDNLFFGNIINYFGDLFTIAMMKSTVMQDKAVIENINLKTMDGKFNMKFDKLQNVYRSLYKKLVKNITFS